MRRIPMAGLALALTLGAAPMLAAQSVHGREPAARQGWQQQGPGRQFGRALFRGIQLSPAQRARLEQIRSRYQAQTQALRGRMQPAMREARADRQRGDDAAARAVFQRTARTRVQMRQVRKRELKDIRGVLNRDQRRAFDANVKQLREHMKERVDHARQSLQRNGPDGGQHNGWNGQNGRHEDRGPQR